MIPLLLALIGCSSVNTLYGARTLEPGQTSTTLALSAGKNTDPLAGTTAGIAPLPVYPQADIGRRFGIAPDLDVGGRLSIGGLGFDVRYRFLHTEQVHLAAAPGVYGSYAPLQYIPDALIPIDVTAGLAEARFPLLMDLDISKGWTLGAGTQVIGRQFWMRVRSGDSDGTGSRFELRTGGHVRTEFRFRRSSLSASFDVLADPLRNAPLAWSGGIQMTFYTDPWRREERRDLRQWQRVPTATPGKQP